MTMSSNPQSGVDVSLEAVRSLVVIRFTGLIESRDLDHAREVLIERLNGKAPAGMVLDARASQPGYTPGQLLETFEIFLDQASPQRCAFVAAKVREETLTLIETACVPYAVRVRRFEDLQEAQDWAAGL